MRDQRASGRRTQLRAAASSECNGAGAVDACPATAAAQARRGVHAIHLTGGRCRAQA
ncbi:hypothetical protein XBLMG947_0492 [Xanthomonas bromi]|uniref:Uncharacterized protein n=1 Tax=Xanthomonas bromi TaxID=56449 RepID=A0A1C3NH30_9XANT|nr:hypothetical protein XBLMG947_0492 [Xanthomonas bromi]